MGAPTPPQSLLPAHAPYHTQPAEWRLPAQAQSTQAPPRLRRRLLHTDAPLAEAVKERLEVIADELRWVPEQLEAAEAYVVECEAEHDRLKRLA